MTPESLTSREIYGSLTPKHWVAVISTIFSCAAAIAVGGYWAGQQYAEAKGLKEIAELNGRISNLSAADQINKSQVEELKYRLNQWIAAYGDAKKIIDSQAAEVRSLNAQLGKNDTCVFLQNQILSTKQDITLTQRYALRETREKEVSDLQDQLARLQAQLGACAH